MSKIQGTVADGFEPVRQGFEEGQLSDEGGAQLCVYHRGKKVVDLWGGQDKVKDRPYTDRTITVLMSCTKGILTTCAHMLVERGQLELDAPVTRYWPTFGQAGKEAITVAQLLTHQAGLPGFYPANGFTARDMIDWTKSTTALAAMAPLWEPGTAVMYHAVTFGFLVGEVVRRASGQMPGQFFAENIARPLGLRLWIGLPETEEANVAPFFASRPSELSAEQWTQLFTGFGIDLTSHLAKGMLHALAETGEAIQLLNTREGHAADVPAGNGIGDAASLAKMYAAIIGEVDGVRLLKRETVNRAREPQNSGLSFPGDLSRLPIPDGQIAYGYGLPQLIDPMLGPGSFGNGGAGGRLGFAHPESETAVAYTCNNMVAVRMSGPDPRWIPWLNALKDVLGV